MNGTELAVLAILKKKPDSSRQEIADKISKTARTVQRASDSLREKGYIQRVGSRYDEVVAAISTKEAQSERLANFIKVLKSQDGTICNFDSSPWGGMVGMVEFVTVGRDKEITVTFRDGTEIQA